MELGKKGEGRSSVISVTGRILNESISLLVFSFLDVLDFILCLAYKAADFFFEAEWKPCYCSPSGTEAITRSGKILVSERGESAKVVCLSSSSSTKNSTTAAAAAANNNNNTSSYYYNNISNTSSNRLQLEDVSDTLYNRPSLFSEVSKTTVNELRRLKPAIVQFSSSSSSFEIAPSSSATVSSSSPRDKRMTAAPKNKKGTSRRRSTFTVNSTIVEMLQGKIGGQLRSSSSSSPPHPSSPSKHPIPRWSDCDCNKCTCWTTSPKEALYVRVHGADHPPNKDTGGGGGGGVGGGGQIKSSTEDVLFIHGFISSSKFWTETVFPNLSGPAKSRYRFFAVDLLGFGRSPKPADSLYTLREHVEMIERSVIDPYKVTSFHIVAHSLGCILALALAVKHPGSIKSLTLLAPPYFPAPKKGEEGQEEEESATRYVLRSVAPRRVWPPIAFGASIACWYEHISRTVCLLICKNHRIWEFLTKLIIRNRVRTFLLEGFFCHTHNAAWHTLHNIICGTANKLEGYLDTVRDRLKCNVTILHGRDDELIPVECSYNVHSKIPRSNLKIIDHKDHITIVVGRQQAFARELEEIWNQAP